jgi:hypothetical protein
MQSNKKEFVVLLDGQFEYVIKESTSKKGYRILRLFYSDSEFWRADLRNTETLKMVDNGNGIKLSKASKKMDYGELNELRLLFSFSKATDSSPAERESSYEIYSRVEDSVSGESIKI